MRTSNLHTCMIAVVETMVKKGTYINNDEDRHAHTYTHKRIHIGIYIYCIHMHMHICIHISAHVYDSHHSIKHMHNNCVSHHYGHENYRSCHYCRRGTMGSSNPRIQVTPCSRPSSSVITAPSPPGFLSPSYGFTITPPPLTNSRWI
jgi:hypothetical protein